MPREQGEDTTAHTTGGRPRLRAPAGAAPACRLHVQCLGVLVAAKYSRLLNEFPRDRSAMGEKKLTTRALEELAKGGISYRVVPRRRGGGE